MRRAPPPQVCNAVRFTGGRGHHPGRAWLIRRACKPTWLSPISPSISALGTIAATESTMTASIAPERTSASAVPGNATRRRRCFGLAAGAGAAAGPAAGAAGKKRCADVFRLLPAHAGSGAAATTRNTPNFGGSLPHPLRGSPLAEGAFAPQTSTRPRKVTIPPSRLRRDTSLYTREALELYLIKKRSPYQGR